jgi:hypothetical protein
MDTGLLLKGRFEELHDFFESPFHPCFDQRVTLQNARLVPFSTHIKPLTKSPRTAKPWVQPSQYTRLYPPLYFSRSLSASFCATMGSCSSISHPLIKIFVVEPLSSSRSKSPGLFRREGWFSAPATIWPAIAISITFFPPKQYPVAANLMTPRSLRASMRVFMGFVLLSNGCLERKGRKSYWRNSK